MGRRWSQREDELLRKYASEGPGWDGWERILPGRSYSSICQRRQTIGVQFEVGGKSGSHHARRHARQKTSPATKRLAPSTPWSQEQDEALVRCANAMVEAAGHGFSDCVMRVLDLIRAAREDSGGGD